MSNGDPLGRDELALLAAMVEADASASREGHRDETFAIIRLTGGAAFLDHKGLGGRRPQVSPRAVLGLQDAGLFRVVSETPSLLRVYLEPTARTVLAEQSSNVDPDPENPDAQAVAHLLQVVFDRFQATGEWPSVDRLRHELDQADDELDVIGVGQGLDPAYGIVGRGFEARALLTIHGVARCIGSDQVLEDLMGTVRHAYARFSASGPGAKISSADMAQDLGMDQLRLRRTYELLGAVPGLGGGTGGPPGSWDREVTPDITRFKRVETVADLLASVPAPGSPKPAGAVRARSPAPGGLDPVHTARPLSVALAGLHPRVVEVSGSLFDDGHHAQAAFEALKAVELRLRELSGLDLSGRDLAAQALRGEAPRVLINRHSGRTGADEQEGMRFMFMGVAQALRNPGGHELDSLNRDEALEELAVASLLLRWLDTSRAGEPATGGGHSDRHERPPDTGRRDLTPATQSQVPPRLVVLRELRDISHRQAQTSRVLDLEFVRLAERSGVAIEALKDTLVDLLAEGLAEPFADSQDQSAEQGACRITGDGLRELQRLEV